ncbi:MAG: restriction endonuclease [Leptospiraceae bacterium]|nr:MAG: restriction endonuclease [Leptospiraceae bacterium]
MLLKQKKTYEDYKNLPEGTLAQLIDGEIIMSPAPNTLHQKIILKISTLIFKQLEEELKLGYVFISPIDVYFNKTEVYQPDIIFISKENASIIKEQMIEGAPDLVIEVLSPNNAYYDLKYKKNKYAEFGVKEYWIVDPIEKSIEVYINQNKEFILKNKAVLNFQTEISSVLFNKFKIDLKYIFT